MPIRGQAEALQPFLQGRFARNIRAAGQEVALQVLRELGGGDATECELLKVRSQEWVEHIATNRVLDGLEKHRALDVGDAREAIVGVPTGKVHM